MDHSNSLKNVPKVDSEEFEKFLEDNGFYNTMPNKLDDNSEQDQPKRESVGNTLLEIVNNWRTKHPGPSLAIVLGGSVLICYKMTVGMLSQAVFKGNLKTSRYFDKHASR